MRRKLFAGLPMVTLVIGALVTWQVRPTTAQPAPDTGGKSLKSPAPTLPIAQVILFNSGVGYFQREGEVEGNTRVDLSFPGSDVNDLLKSMVLQDLGGGKVSTVSYDSPDPIEKTLKSFAIDLTNNPSFGQLLNQTRGEKIEVTMQQTAASQPGTLSGIILGMESQQPAGQGRVGEVELLNLLCTEGMRSVPLSQVQRVRLLNPVLDNELRRALEVLAASHDMQKKMVSVGFTGEGKRSVRVGYVVENPIWKTSYRLVFDRNGKPLLQGWAVVENTSDEDWKDVRMALISGRPLSFQMNLYQPLYIPRPTVEPELFASLRPPVYAGALAGQLGIQGGNNLGALGVGGGQLGGLGNLGAGFGFQGGGFNGGGFNGGGFNGGNRYQAGNLGGQFGQQGGPFMRGGRILTAEDDANQAANAAAQRLTFEELQKRRQELEAARKEAGKVGPALAAIDPKDSIDSVTAAGQIGDHFQYLIDQKVSLPRQKSALLPIVNKDIECTKVSIYNESVHAKFPLLGLRFKNTTGQPLTQGPITVFERGCYAGDARILDLQPNEERLLSYAIDLGTEIKTITRTTPDQSQVTLKPVKGLLHVGYRMRQTTTYIVKNRSEHERLTLIEQPIRAGWKLANPEKPAERSRDVYRFELAAPAGKTVSLYVVEEQDRVDPVTLTTAEGKPVHYALPHLAAEVQLINKRQPDQLLSVRLLKGLLGATYTGRETRTYVLRNLADKDRTFVIDHLARPSWKLLAPDNPKGQTEPALRLQVPVAAGKTANRELVEEETRLDELGLKMISDESLRAFQSSSVTRAPIKAALRKTLELRARLTETERQLAESEKRLKAITDDQSRLRANLEKVPQTSAAYKRYLEKFDTQETEIEKLQLQIKEQQEADSQRKQEYDEYASNASVE
jgi:hypothetical protein